MALIPYTKPHASAAQRVQHLQAKGLHVPKPKVAARKIERIGYERLRIYFLSRRQLTVAGRPFLPGTTYHDILRIYECDQRLRNICFSAVCQFEILFRNALSEALSAQHGSHPYNDVGAFRGPAEQLDALKTIVRIYGDSRDARAKHYKTTYSDPVLPPIWTLKEFLTFGASARIFQNLAGPLRTEIAKQFGVGSDQVFSSWLLCFVDLRNICAHHDRLFNRSFQRQPATLHSASVPTAPAKKLKAVLECLDHVLKERGTAVAVTSAIGKTITRFPEVQPSEAGY